MPDNVPQGVPETFDQWWNDIHGAASQLTEGDHDAAAIAYNAGRASLAAENERLRAVVDAIDFLRSEEGDVVEILCDNPDFNGMPDRAVVCNGWWTNHLDRRFGGHTLAEALLSAVAAKNAAIGEPAGNE